MARYGVPLLVVAVATIALYMASIELPPEDVPYPYITRSLITFIRGMISVADMLEYVGVQSWARTMRAPQSIPMPTDESMAVRDDTLGGVPVRVYTPPGASPTGGPYLFYIHGGGWVLLSAKMYDPVVWDLAVKMKMVAISVEYRRAPEHPYPAAIDDVFAAFNGLAAQADAMGLDKTKVVIAGDSAGGNLAAALSQRLRDTDAPVRPKLQILIYPVLQFSHLQLPSASFEGGVLRSVDLARYMTSYLGVSSNFTNTAMLLSNRHVHAEFLKSPKFAFLQPEGAVPEELRHGYAYEYPQTRLESHVDREPTEAMTNLAAALRPLLTDPYLAPLMADDVRGLPPTLQIPAEYDILRDDTYLYKRRLDEAGVANRLHLLKNGLHGIVMPNFLQPHLYDEALDVIRDEIAKVLP